MWSKGVNFKMAFCLWRIWNGKIPMDDIVARNGCVIVSRGRCCRFPQQETLENLFLSGDLETLVWNRYTAARGLYLNGGAEEKIRG